MAVPAHLVGIMSAPARSLDESGPLMQRGNECCLRLKRASAADLAQEGHGGRLPDDPESCPPLVQAPARGEHRHHTTVGVGSVRLVPSEPKVSRCRKKSGAWMTSPYGWAP